MRRELEAKYPYIQLVPEVLPYLPLLQQSHTTSVAESSAQVAPDRLFAQGKIMFNVLCF